MKRLRSGALALLLCILVLLPAPSALAASGRGEVHIILDFFDQHEVGIVLPEGSDPAPLVEELERLLAVQLRPLDSWDEDFGQVWIYAAPGLIDAGSVKQQNWDLIGLPAMIQELGLTALDFFVVVTRPGGALGLEVALSDGVELLTPAADEWEVWWGFGLSPGGGAPSLNLQIRVFPVFTWASLAPFWLPLVLMLLVWPLGWLLTPRKAWIIGNIVHVLGLLVACFLSILLQWVSLWNALLGSRGLLPHLSLFLALLLPTLAAQLTIGLRNRQLRLRQLAEPKE
ncbi:MAG: hypothetical protein ACOX18_09435 [Bacillota bacterium]